MAPKSQSAAQPIRRKFNVPSWVWSLALVAVAALTLSIVGGAQGAPAPTTLNTNPAAWMVQAQESMAHYGLDVSAAPAIDPAVKSVLDYIAIHEAAKDSAGPAAVPAVNAPIQSGIDYAAIQRAQQASSAPAAVRAIDPAVQSVFSYLAVHGFQYASEAPEVVADAGALSYTDFLRRNGLIPDTAMRNQPTDPAVQALTEDYLLHMADAAPQGELLVDPYGREMETYIAEHGLSAAVGAPDLARDAFAKNLTEYLRQRTENRFNASPVVDVPPDQWWLHQGEEPAP